MGKVLGDYKGTVPSTLITQKEQALGARRPKYINLSASDTR